MSGFSRMRSTKTAATLFETTEDDPLTYVEVLLRLAQEHVLMNNVAVGESFTYVPPYTIPYTTKANLVTHEIVDGLRMKAGEYGLSVSCVHPEHIEITRLE